MEKYKIKISKIPVSINFSKFSGKEGVKEYHLVFIPEEYESFEKQIKWIYKAYRETIKDIGIDEDDCVFSRFFCSDLFNQINYLKNFSFLNSAISYVSQPPGPNAKVGLWIYSINDPYKKIEKVLKENSICVKREKNSHYWITGITNPEGNIEEQTTGILKKLKEFLNENKMDFLNNMIRTWFFLKNIDTDYKEFVIARKNFYAENGLTEKTHFISSTGVGGAHFDINVRVFMDGYAISGISNQQIKYLSAPRYLSSPYIYGVTFERGTSISYRDRKHVIISGTASINNKGEILYQGDILKQLDRTVRNIQALLENAGCGLEDISIAIVYLRDPTDYEIVNKKLKEIFKRTPFIITFASVCRPGWLIEIECMAAIPYSNQNFPSF